MFQVTSVSPLGVRFYMQPKGGKHFIPDEEAYEISHLDILKHLPEPDVKLIGSRLYYTFET